MAVVDIITSKTFDNGTICASEQTVVIDDEIYDRVLEKFAELGAHICNEKETELLGRTVIDPETGFMQPMAVGQKATDIARVVGLSVKPDTKLLIAPIQGVGRDHPLSVEKLFPVLAVYRAKSVEEALRGVHRRESCRRTGAHGGRLLAQRRGHPQVQRGDQRGPDHREFAGIDRRAGRRLQRHGADLLVRMRHRRRQQHHRQRQRLSLPQYQTRGSEDTSAYVVPRSQSDLLQHERGREPAPVPVALHHHHHQSDAGADWATWIWSGVRLPPETQVHVLVIPDAEPEVKVVMQGVEALNFYKADQIIALGGGSVIDAAKIMKLKYESPEADLEELAAPFLDIRKRVVAVPDREGRPGAADRHLHHQRNGQRSHSVRRPDR